MIFYFSGTGNTRWAAIQIGAATQERLINIADYSDYLSADKDIEPFALQEGERLGFVSPFMAGECQDWCVRSSAD